jgi:hypothetical protein
MIHLEAVHRPSVHIGAAFTRHAASCDTLHSIPWEKTRISVAQRFTTGFQWSGLFVATVAMLLVTITIAIAIVIAVFRGLFVPRH